MSFKSTRLAAAVAAIGILAIALTGCGGGPTATQRAAQTTGAPPGAPAASQAGGPRIDELVIAFRGDAATLDPHMRNETTTVTFQEHIYDALVALDADGKLVPQLAEKWERKNDTSWVFTLRKGVKFHNGDPFNAEAAAFSIMRAKKHPKSQMAHNIVGVKDARSLSDGTLEIITDGPFPSLILGLQAIKMVSPKYAEAAKDEKMALEPMGTGPYKFVRWVKSDHMALEANPDWWGGKVDFPKVKLRPIPDAATRVAALISGEVHVAESINVEDVDRVKAKDTLKVERTPSQRVIYLTMTYWPGGLDGLKNTDGKNPFMDVRVRKAIYHAINEDEIIKFVMGGAASPASQYIHPKSYGYNSNVKRLPYDPEKAKQLLREAGYPNGFPVRLDAPNDRYINDKQIAEAIVGQLRKVGIDAQLNAVPKSKFFPDMDAGKFSMYLAGWGTNNISSTLNGQVRTPDKSKGVGHVNRIRLSNKRIDELIQKADVTLDDKERERLYQEVIRIAQDDLVAWVPLHYEELIFGVNKSVSFTPRFDEAVYAFEMKRVR